MTRKRQLLGFVLDVFAACDKDTAKRMIKRGSIELWRPVLEEIRRVLVKRASGWTSPEAAELRAKVRNLLDDLEETGKSGHSFWNTNRVSKWYLDGMGCRSENAKMLLATLKNLKKRIAEVDADAAKVALEARTEHTKASLKRAPWEVD